MVPLKMNILITQRHQQDKHGQWVDCLENSYVGLFESLGCCLFAIPNNTRQIEAYLKRFDVKGIVLTGGGDIDPRRYGAQRGDSMFISPQRERLELELLNVAVARQLPVLGICRGMQTMNLFFNGSLHPHLPDYDEFGIHTPGASHTVDILEPQLLKALNGKTNHTVNSYHNQGVLENNLGDMTAFALQTQTGVIEGLYHNDHPIAGVQWHPEREEQITSLDMVLMTAFLQGKLFWRNST